MILRSSLLLLLGFVWPCQAEVWRLGTYDGVERIWPQAAEHLVNAGKAIGVDIELEYHRAEDSLMMAVHGQLDGDFLRQPGAVLRYPSLVRIDVPLVKFDYWIWMPIDKHCPENRQAARQLKPVGVTGQHYFRHIYALSNVGFEEAPTTDLAARMLAAGRADYLTGPLQGMGRVAGRNGLELKSCLDKPLFSLYGYAYLNAKHRQHVSNLAEVLRALGASVQ